MDITKFTSDSPGRIVPIQRDWGADAFVPDPLPANCVFPSRLWPLLSDTKVQIALLEGIGRTLPNPGVLLKPLTHRESIQSSRIEGTYTSPKELLLQDEPPPTETRKQDWLEVYNYERALDYSLKSELPLSLRLLRDMHRILMTGVRGQEKTPGEFRNLQVIIGRNRRFIPPPPELVPQCLHDFELYLNTENTSFDPLIKCFLSHYQFESIHPFSDGNGRVGRLLLAVMLQRECRLTKPWLYLSDYFEQHRDDYCDLMFAVSARGNWETWMEFCLLAAKTQAEQTILRCERLQKVREDFIQRLKNAGGKLKLHTIVEYLFHSPFVRVTDIRDNLKINYKTAKSDLQRLCGIGILTEMEGESQMTFYCPEIYAVAYEDLDVIRHN